MDLDYTEKGSVKVSMMRYTGKVLKGFHEMVTGSAASPAQDHLFKVRDESDPDYKPLTEDFAQSFHHTTTQLLFMCSRARRDIQTAVAFLTTRVKKPDQDDWGKLKRVLKYLNGTKHMKLKFMVDNLSIIKWWIDASYNIHWDARGHNGAMMTMGKGAIISNSNKQKLNVGSST